MSKKQKPVKNTINPEAPFFKQAVQTVSVELLTAAFIAGQTAVITKPLGDNKPGFILPDEDGNLKKYNFTDNSLNRFMLGLMDFLNQQNIPQDMRPAVLMRSQILLNDIPTWDDLPEWVIRKDGDVAYISEYAFAAAAVVKINTNLVFDREEFITLAKNAQERSA